MVVADADTHRFTHMEQKTSELKRKAVVVVGLASVERFVYTSVNT